MYLCNISDKDFVNKSNKFLPDVHEWVQKRSPGSTLIPFSITFEQRWVGMTPEEQAACESQTMVPRISVTGYKALGLIHYFTCGKVEVRAWTIKNGTLAPGAAGVIHTDFQRCFVNADMFAYDDLIKYGSEAEVKKAGKLMQRGKEYEVKDGDIAFFRHTAGGAGNKKK